MKRDIVGVFPTTQSIGGPEKDGIDFAWGHRKPLAGEGIQIAQTEKGHPVRNEIIKDAEE